MSICQTKIAIRSDRLAFDKVKLRLEAEGCRR